MGVKVQLFFKTGKKEWNTFTDKVKCERESSYLRTSTASKKDGIPWWPVIRFCVSTAEGPGSIPGWQWGGLWSHKPCSRALPKKKKRRNERYSLTCSEWRAWGWGLKERWGIRNSQQRAARKTSGKMKDLQGSLRRCQEPGLLVESFLPARLGNLLSCAEEECGDG